jgi:hypothetical protein
MPSPEISRVGTTHLTVARRRPHTREALAPAAPPPSSAARPRAAVLIWRVCMPRAPARAEADEAAAALAPVRQGGQVPGRHA